MRRHVKTWVIGIGVLLFFASFFLSDSFRSTFRRRRALHQAKRETRLLDQKIDSLRQEMNDLKNHPETYEHLVRKELGYVRPGEKEIRFVQKTKGDK